MDLVQASVTVGKAVKERRAANRPRAVEMPRT
jgi:hypothetical protein